MLFIFQIFAHVTVSHDRDYTVDEIHSHKVPTGYSNLVKEYVTITACKDIGISIRLCLTLLRAGNRGWIQSYLHPSITTEYKISISRNIYVYSDCQYLQFDNRTDHMTLCDRTNYSVMLCTIVTDQILLLLS